MFVNLTTFLGLKNLVLNFLNFLSSGTLLIKYFLIKKHSKVGA